MENDMADFCGKNPLETVASHLSTGHSRSSESIDSHSSKRMKPSTDLAVLATMVAVSSTRTVVYGAIDLVLAGLPLQHSYNRYYQLVESLCRYKHNEQSKLATELYERLENRFEKAVKPQVLQALAVEDVKQSMAAYVAAFEDWQLKLLLLCKLFLYLDRGYLLPHHSKKPILEYGIDLFIDQLVNDDYKLQLLHKHNVLLCQFRQQEYGEDEALAVALTQLLLKLNRGQHLKLHLQLMDLVVSHYNQLKGTWTDPEQYLGTVLRKLSQEITFWKRCGYDNVFLRDLLLKLKWNLIFIDFQTLIEEILPYVLHRDDQLQVLFKFCQCSVKEYQFESMKLFIHTWGQYLQNIFEKTISDLRMQYQAEKSNILESIVEMYLKYKSIADSKFFKEEKFEFEFRSAFNKVLNQKSNNLFIILLLNKYCDGYFRNKKSQAISFEEFKQRVVIIFKSINNKNLFIIPYKKDLSKRLLLLNRDIDERQEMELANVFLSTMGENDESVSLQQMFNDLKLSKEQYDRLELSSSIDFTPLILEKRYWPDIPKIDPNDDNELILPPILQDCIEQFTVQFRESDTKNRNKVLDWKNYGLHQLVLAVQFDQGNKELVVNLYQAVVVLLFAEKERYSLDELKELTGIDEKFTKRIISSLIKCKIVIQEGDEFEFNFAWQEKSARFKVPFGKDNSMSSKEAKTIERLQTIELIERSRQEEFRGILMKIMKLEKEMLVTELLNKSIEILQPRGPVTVQDLKSSIEYLIESEYLQREDKHSLKYVP